MASWRDYMRLAMPDGASLIRPTDNAFVGRIRHLCRHPAKLIKVRARVVPVFVSREGEKRAGRAQRLAR
ncbi:hypothetical protein GBC03_04075 [Citrobacter telavivensis]|nr:hypothetical protein GBC03_04075 [Citrobacter telavivensis]